MISELRGHDRRPGGPRARTERGQVVPVPGDRRQQGRRVRAVATDEATPVQAQKL
jgi:hypothetical protein